MVQKIGAEFFQCNLRFLMKAAYQKWPDVHVTIEDMIAGGDKVMARSTWRAADAVSRNGIEFHGFVLWRFSKRESVERWASLTAPREV